MKIYQVILLLLLYTFSTMVTAVTKISIIVPIAHEALEEIITGFEETLKSQYKKPIIFKLSNAQNDQNLQYAILKQMRDSDYDIIVPVTTQTSLMAINLIKNKPIVSLAADIKDNQRNKLTPCNLAVVDDEISSKEKMLFIHAVFPQIKSMVLIHSVNEKILPEVEDTKEAAVQLGIKLQTITIQTLMDLQSVARILPKNTQGIFILKDNLIANGIAQLVHVAKINHIPLITSDDGTVKNGATMGIGIRERQIGIDGAMLAKKILEGEQACNLPIVKMEKLAIFINKKALEHAHIALEPILTVAKKNNYDVDYLD